MTKQKAKAAAPATQPSQTLEVDGQPGKSKTRQLADISVEPAAHAMAIAHLYNKGSFGEQNLTDIYDALADQVKVAEQGDLSHQRALLAAQADALNAIFTEMARRASNNMGEYLNATQLYLRLGLKAQAQCRATIEALERLTNGHVQTVKHVHVSEGGQAVIADQFHHHTGGQENGQSIEQPHATGSGAAGASAALPSPNPLGNGMPIPSRQRQPTV